MKYIISDIHGAYHAYQKLKEKAGYNRENDLLFVLGDVLDGNNRHPEDALRVLDDIMADDHIHLILGNHEAAHLQYHDAVMSGNKSAAEAWEKYLNDPLCGGTSLLSYFCAHQKEWDFYIKFLQDCPLAFLVSDNERLYYLVHGAPRAYHGEPFWQYVHNFLNGTPSFTEDLAECIVNNPALSIAVDTASLQNLSRENLYCIVGHTPTKYVGKPEDNKFQRIYYKNHIYDIDCGCRANTLGTPMNGSSGKNVQSALCMMQLGEKHKCYYVTSND